MVNRLLLDHEFFMKSFMKQLVLRLALRASCAFARHDRGTAERSEKPANLAVGSHVLKVGAWQSRSLPYVTHRDGFGEAGVEIEVFALGLSGARVVAGLARFARPSFKVSPNATGLASGFQCLGIDRILYGFSSIYLFNYSGKF